MYYTPGEIALLLRLHVKTVLGMLRAGAMGGGIVNVGSEVRPDYRVPASAVNGWLAGRRVFQERDLPQPGVAAGSEAVLRRKVRKQLQGV